MFRFSYIRSSFSEASRSGQEELEDTKGEIRVRKSEEGQTTQIK
jgi:hypothetical protein